MPPAVPYSPVDSMTATVPLNAVGIASWAPPAVAIGTHTASATYSGDASFNAASASAVSFTVAKGQPFINAYVAAISNIAGGFPNINVGGSMPATIVVGPFYGQLATGTPAPFGTVTPTGTVMVCLGQIPELGAVCSRSELFSNGYPHTSERRQLPVCLRGSHAYESCGRPVLPQRPVQR